MPGNDLFGPERKSNKLGMLWTTMTGVVVVLVIFIISFLFSRIQLPTELKEVSLVLESMGSLSDDNLQAGGDIVIMPENILEPEVPKLTGDLSLADDFSAKSILVKDNNTGAILYRKNEYEIRSIASITKLMSALVVLENKPDWSAKATVIGADSLGTHMYAGDTYTLDELWYAGLVGSSNKAILTLVDALDISSEEFVDRMNQKAWELGMSDTVFVEPTGLGEGDRSNASDLVHLLNEAMRHEKIREALMTTEYNLYSVERDKKHHIWNTDWLLLNWVQNDFFNFFGGKTGYTEAAGYSFVMQVANEDGSVIDVVILGADDHEARFTEARDIAEMVFKNYKWPEI